jgi:hypothetical protein
MADRNYQCEVVTFSADLGQPDPMDHVEQNALRTGAIKSYVEDLKETFVRDYVFPCSGPTPSMKASTCWAPPSPGPDRQAPDGDRAAWKAPMPSATAPPARATIRCALN